MPNIRSLLLIALAFVGYLMWQAWEQDYAQVPQSTDAPAATTAPPIPADAPRAADAPSAADLPTAPATQPAPTVAADTAARGERVRVKTDVLDIEIDTRGGTFVEAKLPIYPVKPKAYDQPVQLFNDDPANYYVAQSGLVSANAAAPDHRATYRAERTSYTLDKDAKELVVPLTWTEGGVTVTKRFVFKPSSYVIDVQHEITNAGGTPWSGSVYRQLQRTSPIVNRKFSFTNPEQYSFVGAAWYSPEGKFEKLNFEDFAEDALANRTFAGGWAAMLQHYFFSAWLPPEGEVATYSTSIVNDAGAPRYLIRQVANPITVAPGATTVVPSRLYVGPKLQSSIGNIAPGLHFVIDYGMVTFLAEPLFWLLNWLHSILGNWGFAIIAVTVLIKAAFFKLSEAQYRSMARMRKVQPRLAALKERYGDDRQKMNQAMMELYQKEKINPFGGCLPMLVQIPVFIALYWVLIESVELVGSSRVDLQACKLEYSIVSPK